MAKVPYDNDPRPLKPANPNLKPPPKYCGPNPTQDGPNRGTAAAPEDAFAYLDVSGSDYDYLEHFRERKFVEEGHNETNDPRLRQAQTNDPMRSPVKRPGTSDLLGRPRPVKRPGTSDLLGRPRPVKRPGTSDLLGRPRMR